MRSRISLLAMSPEPGAMRIYSRATKARTDCAVQTDGLEPREQDYRQAGDTSKHCYRHLFSDAGEGWLVDHQCTAPIARDE